jgi:hypothetical protein
MIAALNSLGLEARPAPRAAVQGIFETQTLLKGLGQNSNSFWNFFWGACIRILAPPSQWNIEHLSSEFHILWALSKIITFLSFVPSLLVNCPNILWTKLELYPKKSPKFFLKLEHVFLNKARALSHGTKLERKCVKKKKSNPRKNVSRARIELSTYCVRGGHHNRLHHWSVCIS